MSSFFSCMIDYSLNCLFSSIGNINWEACFNRCGVLISPLLSSLYLCFCHFPSRPTRFVSKRNCNVFVFFYSSSLCDLLIVNLIACEFAFIFVIISLPQYLTPQSWGYEFISTPRKAIKNRSPQIIGAKCCKSLIRFVGQRWRIAIKPWRWLYDYSLRRQRIRFHQNKRWNQDACTIFSQQHRFNRIYSSLSVFKL